MDDIRVLAFFHIEQAFLMGFVGMALIGVRLNWKQLIFIGILQGTVVYLSRGLCDVLGLPFGTHSLISFISLIVVLWMVLKMGWGITFTAAALAFITVMLSEGLIAPVLHTYVPHVLQDIRNDVWRYVGISYCTDWLLIATALYLGISKNRLMDLGAKRGKV